MLVTVRDDCGTVTDQFETPGFDRFWHAPEHFTRIAPAYLAVLNGGSAHADVTYFADDLFFTERHRPALDGFPVKGTVVEVFNGDPPVRTTADQKGAAR